jgi:hypothetical protein
LARLGSLLLLRTLYSHGETDFHRRDIYQEDLVIPGI